MTGRGTGRPNLSGETKFSGAKGGKGKLFFSVQLDLEQDTGSHHNTR